MGLMREQCFSAVFTRSHVHGLCLCKIDIACSMVHGSLRGVTIYRVRQNGQNKPQKQMVGRGVTSRMNDPDPQLDREKLGQLARLIDVACSVENAENRGFLS